MSSQSTLEELPKNLVRWLKYKVDLDFDDLNFYESESGDITLANPESYKHNPLFFTRVNGAVVNQSKIKAFIKLDQLVGNNYFTLLKPLQNIPLPR